MTLVDPTTLPVTSDLGRRLRAHVEYLASPALQGRKPGTPGNRQAAKYISARFRDLGLDPLPSLSGYGQPISIKLGDNLIAVRPGRTAESEAPWLLVGAHFDHLGGNYLGADDNAAAVAILIETARALPRLARHHLLLAAFNTEEPPYIRTSSMGSQHFMDHLPSEIGGPGRIRTAIIMDLMGGVHWSPLKEAIFAGGAEKSPGLYRRLKEASGTMNDDLSVLSVGMHLVEEIPLMGQVAFSDYDAFRNAQVPFVFLSAGRTPRYHQPTDLPDTLHYERMAATVGWLTDLIECLDQDRAPYGFHRDRIEFSDEVAALAPLIRQAAERDTMIPGTSTLSLWKLQADRKWLEGLDPASPTRDDLKRLEHASLRMQCLLMDFAGCFLL